MNESLGAEGNSWTIPTTWNGHDLEAAGRVVEHAQPQQVADVAASSR